MEDDPRKRVVREGYDAIAGQYLDWSRNSSVRQLYLEKLLALLPSDARVLELGCGAGVPVTRALAEKHRVTAIDVSGEQIALAKVLVPTAELLCADMMAVDFPENSFDAVAAFYSISHVPREEQPELLRRVTRWLKPDGIFLGTLGALESPGKTERDWLGVPMFFSHFDAPTNLTLVRAAGLDILSADIVVQDLVGEENVIFLWVIARRAKP